MPINSFLYPGPTNSNPYVVDNSCRFNDGDSAYMSRTLGTPTDPEKWTWSCWVKRSTLGATQTLFSYDSGGTLMEFIGFNSTDSFRWYHRTSGGTVYHLNTNRLFRDVSAWYHFLVVYDSSQGTDSNRVKFFVNGTQETSFATSSYPAQDLDSELNKANAVKIYSWNGSEFFDGYIAENVFCDGQAYTTTDFGEFDSDSPTIWKPIDPSGLTFGTNGFYLDFEDSANLGNDANGGTDWSETNLAATDQATDSPTNNFCTLNPIFGIGRQDQLTYSEGNTVVVSGATSGSDTVSPSTFALNSGKWYAEFKLTDDADGVYVGVAESNFAFTNSGVDASGYANIWLVRGDDGTRRNNDNNAYVGSAFSDDEIISIAIDMDNSKIWWAVDGTYPNSGDPAAGSNAAFTNLSGELIIIVGDNYSSKTPTIKANFGNPSYANSSSAADANGYGDFEFAPPSGFYALCTKNLAEFG